MARAEKRPFVYLVYESSGASDHAGVQTRWFDPQWGLRV